LSIFDKRRQIKAATEAPAEPVPVRKLSMKRRAYTEDPATVEMNRILALPVVGMLEKGSEEFEEVCYRNMLAEAFDRGERLLPTQASAIKAYDEIGGGFYPIGVGWGKCSRYATELYDMNTGRRLVGESGPLTTPSMTPQGLIVRASAISFPSGKKECVRVSLRSGEWIEVSLDHPIFTARGWVEAVQVRDDDLVACPRSLPAPTKYHKVPDDLVIFLAYMMADGGTSGKRQPDFTNMEDEIWTELNKVVCALGGTLGASRKSGRAKTRTIRGLNPLLSLLKQRGKLSKNKRLPAEWYLLPEDQCAFFLSRFIACDGHIDPLTPKIEITLANEGLIRDLRHLLLRLQIICTVYPKTIGEFKAWRLMVTGEEAIRLMNKLPQIPGKSRVQEIVAAHQTRHNTNIDIVPISRRELQKICDEMGIPGRGGCWKKRKQYAGPTRTELRTFMGCSADQYVGRDQFRKFVAHYNYSGKYSWLAHSNLVWRRIKNIESIGKHRVYDLNVPDTKSWIGNGVIVHNTGITLLVAEHAYRKGLNRIVLLIPPSVQNQLVQGNIPWWRRRIPLSVPFFVLGGRNIGQRRLISKSGRRGCYILPYSLLSTEDSVELLEAIQPDCFIADEVHCLKNKRSGRTKRLMHFVKELNPEFIGMSGTITSKGIEDYHHLALAALKENAPVPRTANMAYAWGQVINTDATVESSANYRGNLIPLIHWARGQRPREQFHLNVSGFRNAFQLRLNTAPGVVATGDNEIGTSLSILNQPVQDPEKSPGWDQLQSYIEGVQEAYLTPGGDEIEHAIHCFKWLNELTAGFFNNLVWPEPEVLAKRRVCTLQEAEKLLKQAKAHHTAQQDYAKLLRRFLQDAPLGMDTPMEVARIINRRPEEVSDDVVAAYWEMKDRDFEGRPERDRVAVRVCPYKIDAAVQWARNASPGAILWVWHREVAYWLVEALRAAGLDPLHCPAGKDKEISAVGDPDQGGKGDRIVVASIGAHHVGKNLQAFKHQRYVQWPRDSKVAEQVLGRLHRVGQKEDHLDVVQTNTSIFDHVLFGACLNDALYTHQTTGLRQKLIFANYDPMPKIYSPEFLRERGANPQTLNKEQRKMMQEMFGSDWTDRLR
jgi:hypothetical protein